MNDQVLTGTCKFEFQVYVETASFQWYPIALLVEKSKPVAGAVLPKFPLLLNIIPVKPP